MAPSTLGHQTMISTVGPQTMVSTTTNMMQDDNDVELIEVRQPDYDSKVREKPLQVPDANTMCTRENCVIAELSDGEMECEDGASPALLGGFIVPACAGEVVDLYEN